MDALKTPPSTYEAKNMPPKKKTRPKNTLSSLSTVKRRLFKDSTEIKQISSSKINDTECSCGSLTKLMCTELLSSIEKKKGLCPGCNKYKRQPRKRKHEVLKSPIKEQFYMTHENTNLICDSQLFSEIAAPFAFETKTPTDETFSVVYVPHSHMQCAQYCNMEKKADIIGSGAYGKVYSMKNLAIKKSDDTETRIGAFVSGCVRTNAGADSRSFNCIYHNLLIPHVICFQHNTALIDLYDTDLYRFQNWNVKNIQNYYKIFCGLADGLRFLNLQCKISHLDVSLMNILLNYDEDVIFSAVLTDYSLSEIHPKYNRSCAIAREYDKKIQLIQAGNNKLCDMYHPAYKPILAQKMIALNIYSSFDNSSNPVRHCNFEFGALGYVILFCLVRMLDERGCYAAKVNYENRLFTAANAMCKLSPLENPKEYREACCKLLGEQIVLVGLILHKNVTDIYENVYDFLDNFVGVEMCQLFDSVYLDGSRQSVRHPIRKKYKFLMSHEYGQRLIKDLTDIFSVVSFSDLDRDPSRILYISE